MNQKSKPSINGKKLAREILENLKPTVVRLKKKSIKPHLAVVLIGSNQASLSYIAQKEKAARRARVKLTLEHFKRTPPYQELAESILKLSKDPLIHGVIIQRPLPPTISSISVNRRVDLIKDVDGFREKSQFDPPVARAVIKILNEIYFVRMRNAKKPKDDFTKPFIKWLKEQNVVLMGRGETGGKPIAKLLRKHRVRFIMTNSRTENINEFTKAADIIIAAVGKTVVKSSMIKNGCVLVSVGIRKTVDGLQGDYEKEAIKEKAIFYTPTPGGVGPVNVACLIQNVVEAAKLQQKDAEK